MKALITGGAGFIGQHLARTLTGWDLTALDVLSPQVHVDPEASRTAFPGEVVVASVTDPGAWAGLGRPDVVIHLAAETGTAQSMYEGDRYRRVNVDGTRLAGEAARRWGVPIVFTSSRAVYGEGRHRRPDGTVGFGAPAAPGSVPEASTEDDPHVPVSVYGETKSEGEQALLALAGDIGVGIVRPQNVIGPGQALHNPYTGVLAAWLARMREGQPLLVYGDGSQTRDVVSVHDVVATLRWLADGLLSGALGPEPVILNVGSGVRTTLTELASYAIAGSPSGHHAVQHVDVRRSGDIDHACADLTRSRALGAPPARVSAADAVSGFIRWSWDKPGAASQAWEAALAELADHDGTAS